MSETQSAHGLDRPPKPGPLIPPDRRRDAPLFFVVAILVFLACLAGLAARTAWRAADEWTAALESSATAQIVSDSAEAADTDADAAADLLSRLDGVAEARVLPASESEALLAPWFGSDLPDELPAPRLIALTLDPDAPPQIEAMEAALAAEGIVAVIDDHSRWEADIARAGRAAQGLSLAVVALLAGAAGAVSVFAAQAGLAARREVIEALRVAGASDRLIAFLFLRRFGLMGLLAGAAGAALAGGALGALYLGVIRTGGLVAAPAPGWEEALVLCAAPAAAALIGAVTAWTTVIAELGRKA